MNVLKELFTEANKKLIREAIADAEKNTSGEIRLHVESHSKVDVLDEAAFIFEKLKMHRTADRNGVLIYLAVKDRKLAILGDSGINAKVPENFWNDVVALMTNEFKQERFIEGLTAGIRLAGLQLGEHFPYQKDDVNELSNEISFGE